MTAGAANRVWLNSRAANGSLIVLLAIADELDAKGNCIMSLAELAAKSRLSERAVRNGVAELARLGELETIGGGSGRGNRTAYGLTLKVAESATFEPETRQNLPPLDPEKSATFSKSPPKKPQVRAKPEKSATFTASNVLISTTGSNKAGVKEEPAKPPRPDANRLCEHLAARIEGNGSKRPNITGKWRDAARLMLDKDGRTEQQVMTAIDWCQDHEFWRSNILSMPKLREKYDQLRLQATRERKPPAGRQDPDDDYANALRRIRERKENGNGTRGDSHDSPASQVSLPAAADRRHHLRNLAPRDRRPRIHRRAGRRHRDSPLGEILLSRRHYCRSRACIAPSRPPVRAHRGRGHRRRVSPRAGRRPGAADTGVPRR